jgi:hypothetical protein
MKKEKEPIQQTNSKMQCDSILKHATTKIWDQVKQDVK